MVDDPDFVAAVRDWFDETVWDSPGGYADIRGEAVDDAFAAIDECLAGTGQQAECTAPLGVGPPAGPGGG